MSEAYAYEEPEPDEEMAPAAGGRLAAWTQSVNLVDEVSDDIVARLGERVCEEFGADEDSLSASGWKARHDRALKLAAQVREDKTTPWRGAANVKYPLVTVAAMQFAARAYPAIVDGWNVVKAKPLGRPSEDKRARADRIGAHMTWQLLEEMDGWEEDTDQLLHVLPVTGTVFRKTYFDPMAGKNCSQMVTADKMVVNYWAKPDAPRMTQVCEFYPHEIEAKFRSGVWTRCELGEPQDAANDDQAPHVFLEQHTLFDLDEDGVPEPYVVTVHKDTRKVVRIVARYREDGVEVNAEGEVYRIKPVKYFTRYWFIPPLDGSYYGLGFGALLDSLGETINSLVNQLLDAGTLANMQGGFIGAGVSLKSGPLRFQPGEWKRIEAPGASLRDALVPMPVKEPSNVLFQLLGMLVEAAKDITATKDILTGETQQANTPVGTTLAQIEQGLKVFSSIYKRIHRALRHELGLLYDLNAVYLEQEVYFTLQDDEKAVARTDYAEGDMDVIPVSDPTVVTDMQRIGRAQFLMQFKADPLLDQREIDRRVLEAVGVGEIDALWAKEQGPPPEIALKQEELKLREREVVVKEEAGKAELQSKVASAQKAAAEAIMANPMFAAKVAEFIDIRVKQIEQGATPNGQDVRQGAVPGMEAPPPDGGVPPVPEGPAPGPGEPMGVGPVDGAGAAGQGPPLGGIGGPGVG